VLPLHAHLPCSVNAKESRDDWWCTRTKDAIAKCGGTLAGGVYLRFLLAVEGELLLLLLMLFCLGLVDCFGEVLCCWPLPSPPFFFKFNFNLTSPLAALPCAGELPSLGGFGRGGDGGMMVAPEMIDVSLEELNEVDGAG